MADTDLAIFLIRSGAGLKHTSASRSNTPENKYCVIGAK